MVLESLITAAKAEREPWEAFFLGLLYSSIAIFLSIFIFAPDQVSMVMVFLTVLACTSLMYRLLYYEEKKDIKVRSERRLLQEHAKALSFLMFLFLGFVVSFTLWYVFLPGDLSTATFSSQLVAIDAVNSQFTGNFLGNGTFWFILSNNLKVLFFAIFFSFFYGAGAIFILTWNASVVGAAAGAFIKNILHEKLVAAGALGAASYFTAVSVGLARYLLHGIPEMAAYFVGGISGGLISVAMVHYSTPHFKRVMKDSMMVLGVAVIFLIVAALLEVGVTPALF